MAKEPVLLAGQWRAAKTTGTFYAENPATGEKLPGEFPISAWSDCDTALSAAAEAAAILRTALDAGRQVAPHVTAMVVAGSGLVKEQAESEGLDEVFRAAGFDWREPGCSMCLGMNPDRLAPGERCASTSNRNFEGRQGRGGRTHLMSPAMAAAAAIAGHIADVRDFL